MAQSDAKKQKARQINFINVMYQWGDIIFDSELGHSLSKSNQKLMWETIRLIYHYEMIEDPDSPDNFT